MAHLVFVEAVGVGAVKTVKTVDSHSTIAYHPAEAGVLMKGEVEVDKAEMRPTTTTTTTSTASPAF